MLPAYAIDQHARANRSVNTLLRGQRIAARMLCHVWDTIHTMVTTRSVITQSTTKKKNYHAVFTWCASLSSVMTSE